MKKLLLALFLFLPATACSGNSVQDACQMFYGELKPVPHYELSVDTGLLSSLSDGRNIADAKSFSKAMNN